MVDEHNVFNSYVDFFVFSACVGYAKDRCETQNYKGDSEMLWMHFSNKDLYRAVAAAIAYQHHNDSEALINPELQLKTLTMYAAGGADILEAEFGDIKGNPTNAVLNYIQDWDDQEDNESRQTLLAEIMADFEEGA
ncbi:hypothetical protein [Natronorubrum thiooxidans]|nr:hypothetical protein [Natronorubrum thiooxidans]